VLHAPPLLHQREANVGVVTAHTSSLLLVLGDAATGLFNPGMYGFPQCVCQLRP
jgi:hypothetical protein